MTEINKISILKKFKINRYNLCSIRLIEPEFCIQMNYYSEILDIKFHEDRWKDSTAI